MPISVRVYLLIDNRLFREILARLFRRTSDLLVVGLSSRNEATHESLVQAKCDVLVVDVFDPQWLSECLADARDACAVPSVLLIGRNDDPEQFLAAVRCGVSGYLLHDASAPDFVASVRALFQGEAHCPPKLCRTLFQCVAQTAHHIPDSYAPGRLTQRQQNLVALVSKGFTNKEIASQLHLSEFTVKNHLRRIMRRLKARTRHEAVEKCRIPIAISRVGTLS